MGEKVKVADALGAGFTLVQLRPRLIAGVHHMAPVFLAVYDKPIALGNGTGAVWPRTPIIQSAVIAVHRTHYAIAPNRQHQRTEAYVHGKQQHGAN